MWRTRLARIVRRGGRLGRSAAGILGDWFVTIGFVAVGIFLVGAGLLTYLGPAEAATGPTASPTASQSSGSSARVTIPPPPPSGSASPAKHIPTRIVVPALDIDLAVVAPPANEKFPLCGVAEYMPAFSTPGAKGATFIYAHARTGMFLPFLTQSIKNVDGLQNLVVEVYTDDDLQFLYQVSKVIRHHTAYNLDDAYAVTDEQLWMQTSEGPDRLSTKLEVIATPLGAPFAADHAAAHPTNKGAVCPDAVGH